jgi:hypothetical protein
MLPLSLSVSPGDGPEQVSNISLLSDGRAAPPARSGPKCGTISPTFAPGWYPWNPASGTHLVGGLATELKDRRSFDVSVYIGKCFCGAIEIKVEGEPLAQGYCHCESCRSWSGGPVNAFTLWKPEAVVISKGEENLGVFHKTGRSYRKWCKVCGGHVLTDHPEWKFVDVHAATIRAFPFEPQLHVNHAETVLCMRDGLPKLKDFPRDVGGTGDFVAE